MVSEHPDLALVERCEGAMRAWLGKRSSTPTSQLTGGGAIAHCEARLEDLHRGRPVLLMPSATYALWVALRVLGIGPGDDVLIPKYDWTSSLAVVLALGASPIVVPVDRTTWTIEPAMAAARRTPRTRAVVATHLLAIPADVPALRRALPGIPVVEDCAQAFGSRLDGRPVGVLGDVAAFGFGPGKRLDAGELGALVLRDEEMRTRVLRLSAHPVRQRLSGIALPDMVEMSIRPHPLAAVLLASMLDADDTGVMIQERRRFARSLCSGSGLDLLGVDGRRDVASRQIPVPADQAEAVRRRPGVRVAYAEVQDIEAAASGAHRSERIALLTREEHPLDNGGATPVLPPQVLTTHSDEGR